MQTDYQLPSNSSDTCHSVLFNLGHGHHSITQNAIDNLTYLHSKRGNPRVAEPMLRELVTRLHEHGSAESLAPQVATRREQQQMCDHGRFTEVAGAPLLRSHEPGGHVRRITWVLMRQSQCRPRQKLTVPDCAGGCEPQFRPLPTDAERSPSRLAPAPVASHPRAALPVSALSSAGIEGEFSLVFLTL